MNKQIFATLCNAADYVEFDYHPVIEVQWDEKSIGKLRQLRDVVIQHNITFIAINLAEIPHLNFIAGDEGDRGIILSDDNEYYLFLDTPHVIVSHIGWRVVTYGKYTEGEFTHDIIPWSDDE